MHVCDLVTLKKFEAKTAIFDLTDFALTTIGHPSTVHERFCFFEAMRMSHGKSEILFVWFELKPEGRWSDQKSPMDKFHLPNLLYFVFSIFYIQNLANLSKLYIWIYLNVRKSKMFTELSFEPSTS